MKTVVSVVAGFFLGLAFCGLLVLTDVFPFRSEEQAQVFADTDGTIASVVTRTDFERDCVARIVYRADATQPSRCVVWARQKVVAQ